MDDMSKILEEIDTLKKRVHEMQKNVHVIEEDGFVERVEKPIEGTYCLNAGGGYANGVDLLCRLENTGNGYIVYTPSYSACQQDNYICMDYAEADYLRKLLNYIRTENKA